MNINKLNNKKVCFAAIAAVAAIAAGSARADEIPPGANNAHTPGVAATSTNLKVHNWTKDCVRFYVGGRRWEVQAGRVSDFGSVAVNHQFMASVFKQGCGGVAVKNVWFQTSAAPTVWWDVR